MPPPRLRSPDQPLPLRVLLGLYEYSASLGLAVVLIAGVAVMLAWATFVESRYGTPAVHFGIYDTWWFTILNVLLAWNVLCAALIRFPWRRNQVGFLVTHLGILVLMLGCLFGGLWGIDAQLPVFEGHSAWRAFEHTQHFQLEILPKQGSKTAAAKPRLIDVPFAAGPFNWDDYAELAWFPWRLAHRDRGLLYQQGGIRLEVLDYYADSSRVAAPRLKLRVAPGGGRSAKGGPLADNARPAITLGVRNVDNPHAPRRRFGIGTREELADGTRVVFWMAGSPAETESFIRARPEGPLGPQGQLVLRRGDETFRLPVDSFQTKPRQPLGDTKLEVELIQFTPDFLGVELRVHGPDGRPRRMLLFADAPEFNQQDYDNDLFGNYWYDAGRASDGKEEAGKSRVLADARRRRVDVILGSDGKLHYRAWESPKFDSAGDLPADGTELVVFQKSNNPLNLGVEDLIAADKPTTVVLPEPFSAKKSDSLKQRHARVRLTVDGRSEEFWLAGRAANPLDAPPLAEERKVISGNDRRVALTMPRDEIDVGFQIHLRKFDRRLDPGTSQASHYSSLVDLLDRHDADKCLARDLLITLNAPIDFADPQSGRSYRLFQESFRGPWRPGDPLFDELAAGTARDRLFVSWLTANHDPGRGLKYAGCLLIVGGIALMFYMRTGPLKRRKQK